MAEQRRAGSGRQADPLWMQDDALAWAEAEAERQGLVASSDEVQEWLDGWHEDEPEDDPERLDFSYSRGGSYWRGSWGGG